MASNSSHPETGFEINGLPTPEASAEAIRWLEKTGAGEGKVNYKLRDWLFCRQRFWGEPMPIIYKEGSEVSWGLSGL